MWISPDEWSIIIGALIALFGCSMLLGWGLMRKGKDQATTGDQSPTTVVRPVQPRKPPRSSLAYKAGRALGSFLKK